VNSPWPATAQSSVGPRRWICSVSGTIAALVTTEPIAGAA
jgi:hypothetical protein